MGPAPKPGGQSAGASPARPVGLSREPKTREIRAAASQSANDNADLQGSPRNCANTVKGYLAFSSRQSWLSWLLRLHPWIFDPSG